MTPTATLVTGVSGSGKSTYTEVHECWPVLHMDEHHDYATRVTNMDVFKALTANRWSFTFEGYALYVDYGLRRLLGRIPGYDLDVILLFVPSDELHEILMDREEHYFHHALSKVKEMIQWFYPWLEANQSKFNSLTILRRTGAEYHEISQPEYKELCYE